MARLGGLAVFAGGFWFLFKGFQDSSPPVGVLGGVMVLLGTWILTQAHRGPPAPR